MVIRYLFFTLISFNFFCYGNEWAFHHQITFQAHERVLNGNKSTCTLHQYDVENFTQLLCSWNAKRPKNGYFSFYVQVRDSKNKKWGNWHHMFDWGGQIQQSHMSKNDGFSQYFYVRLEIDKHRYADAFRVKVEAHEGASLKLLHGISVATSNFDTFRAEKAENCKFLASTLIHGIPLIAQLTLKHEDMNRICSPTSCTMVARYLTGKNIDPLYFSQGVYDSGLNIYGSWQFNVAHLYEYTDVNCFVRRFNSFADLHKQLVAGSPVIVSVRGELPGALKPFPHGHLMVVVGWDGFSEEVLCHDPGAEREEFVFKRYSIKHFLAAWERSYRLAYVVCPTFLKK